MLWCFEQIAWEHPFSPLIVIEFSILIFQTLEAIMTIKLNAFETIKSFLFSLEEKNRTDYMATSTVHTLYIYTSIFVWVCERGIYFPFSKKKILPTKSLHTKRIWTRKSNSFERDICLVEEYLVTRTIRLFAKECADQLYRWISSKLMIVQFLLRFFSYKWRNWIENM